MKHRKLRIAWSVAWGVLGLLLVLLWVRSFWQMYSLEFAISDTHGVEVMLFKGATIACHVNYDTPLAQRLKLGAIDSDYNAMWVFEPGHIGFGGASDAFAGFAFKRTRWDHSFGVVWPHWFVLVLILTIGIAPQLLWRFSLRTLLIAMTLAAMLLGLAVYSLRN